MNKKKTKPAPAPAKPQPVATLADLAIPPQESRRLAKRSKPFSEAELVAHFKEKGEQSCDGCGSRFMDGVFYDANIAAGRAVLCQHCYGTFTVNLEGTVKYTFSGSQWQKKTL